MLYSVLLILIRRSYPVPLSYLRHQMLASVAKSTILYYTMLYYTILFYTILYYTILYYTILYYTILYYTILYYTILYYTILYYTILYYTILYYTILYYTILYYTILYYTILYYTILYYTILYYTILYSFSRNNSVCILYYFQRFIHVMYTRRLLNSLKCFAQPMLAKKRYQACCIALLSCQRYHNNVSQVRYSDPRRVFYGPIYFKLRCALIILSSTFIG